MTSLRHTFAFSRRIAPEVLQTRPLRKSRAQGKPGARRTHSLACEIKKHTSKSPQVRRDNPAFPARVVYGLYAISPVSMTSLVTVARAMRKHLSANLAPAKGCQDNATSPSASSAARQSARLRPSHPAPHFVTIAIRPSHRGG